MEATVGANHLNRESRILDDGGEKPACEFSPVTGYFSKDFTEELGDDSDLNHKFLAITVVRTALSESGFIEFDPASNSVKGNDFDLQEGWNYSTFYYTLPAVICHGNVKAAGVISVKIQFQSFGRFCKVYGSLVNGTEIYSVLFDEYWLVPYLNVVWAKCGPSKTTVGNNGVSSLVPFFDVLPFFKPEIELSKCWRKVKDQLVLPLLIDLCEKCGLGLPPCFMRLPAELKFKILESLSGVDIAKVCCVCSELRYLASNEDLWKQKCVEEFPKAEGLEEGRSFREKFWQIRKRLQLIRSNFLPRRESENRWKISHGSFGSMIGCTPIPGYHLQEDGHDYLYLFCRSFGPCFTPY